EQIGDIGTRDQQHETDGSHQREEHDSYRSAVESLIERHDLGIDGLVRVGILTFEVLANTAHFRLGLLESDPAGEPAEQVEAARVAALQIGVWDERYPYIRVGREPHALSHDPDHGRRDVVDLDRFADDARVAAVPRLPQAVSDDCDRFGTFPILVVSEVASLNRPL